MSIHQNIQAQVSHIPLITGSFNFDCVAETSPPTATTTTAIQGIMHYNWEALQDLQVN